VAAAGKEERLVAPAANRDDTCLNCHRAGHWAKDCPQPRRERGGAAHLTEADDDEAALFLAHGFLELETEDILCSKADANLDIDEPWARAFLNISSGEDKLDGWYLDSGATHHMTGRRELFSDLDTSVRGSVRFGDASRVEIQGVGSIVFQAKIGEHRVLHGVYFIPALRNSIMSLGQLDEGGSKVEIDKGVLRIWDRHGRLLVKVIRGPSRLYVHLEAAQPLYLATRKDNDAWRWHERFDHLHFEALHQLGKHAMVRGMPVIKHVEQFYDTCVTTKQRRRPFPHQAKYRA